ncbi:MAG: Tad domain-containing protein [Actinobacteria bacterium]|nr:Tad domain-containing protein [Actinomycetota bacterium]
MRASRRTGGDERGTVLILMALAMTALLGMVALVVDLSQLRTDRRVNKTVADMSVRAGLGVVNLGPWSGVCRASDYLRANAPAFSSFDPGSEKWFRLSSPLSQLPTSPCLNTATSPFIDGCTTGPLGSPNTGSWARLTATAGGGRFSIEVQSGYTMPDSRFPEDVVAAVDTGDPLKGSCDNLVVILTERRTPLLAGVVGVGETTTTIRSVGRVSNLRSEEYSPALLLLEREGCNVLSVASNNSRVIAQPYLNFPGVIQIDSANRGGCSSNQAVLNGATTSGGPSIIACSAKTVSPTPGCNVALAGKPGRIGLYGLNFQPPGAHLTTPFTGSLATTTYGDTQAVRSGQSGRDPADRIYRQNLATLDGEAQAVLTGNGGRPPGCAEVVNSACTANGRTWLVLQQADCNSLGTFFDPSPFPLRTAAPNIWFNCDLNVKPYALLPSGLRLSAPDSYVVITGKLSVTSTFAIVDPRTVFIGGTASGPGIGLDIGNGGNFNVNNPTPTDDCVVPAVVKPTRVVVGNGSFKMGSGGIVHLCQTFVFLANGYGKTPATNGTAPCSSPCSTYLGKLEIGSGSSVDWTAPNKITGRRPTSEEVLLTSVPAPVSPYEDLGLWTEAGGAQSLSGGGNSHMTGVFFLGNANAFTLAGNSGANVSLSAQFITRRMSVTGGATVNLVLNPFDAVPVVINDLMLVR